MLGYSGKEFTGMALRLGSALVRAATIYARALKSAGLESPKNQSSKSG
jgi:hypothetical protein